VLDVGALAADLDVSVACGEGKPPPPVRRSAPDTIILADGFSCRSRSARPAGAVLCIWPRYSVSPWWLT